MLNDNNTKLRYGIKNMQRVTTGFAPTRTEVWRQSGDITGEEGTVVSKLFQLYNSFICYGWMVYANNYTHVLFAT